MTRFGVRPKAPTMEELKRAFPSRVFCLDDGRWMMGRELKGVERRDVVPLIGRLSDKARSCIRYDRMCDAVARQRETA